LSVKHKAQLETLASDSLDVLGDLLHSEDENVQLKAAKEILDRELPVKREVQTHGGTVINLDMSKMVEGLRKVKEIGKGEQSDV
jgi:hypothetical protein